MRRAYPVCMPEGLYLACTYVKVLLIQGPYLLTPLFRINWAERGQFYAKHGVDK